jgi:hypothetical protein
MSVVYEKKQRGTGLLVALSGALVIEAVVARKAALQPGPLAVAALLITCMGVFSSMTIRVTTTEVEWWLALPALRRRLLLADIAAARERSVPLITGFGIKTNGRDWTWIVSGRKAVELTLRNGRRVWLGSSDAQALAELINAAITSQMQPAS